MLASRIWTIDIDEGPAPPPDLGPPFSANAIRNPQRLAAQVTGIIAAYVGAALIIGTLLTTVGRRLRRRSMDPTEMIQPARRIFQSPVSPSVEQRPWYSPRKLASKANSIGSGPRCNSPGMDSVMSFDMQVLEADKKKRQVELERLYAAVMHQDSAGHANENADHDIQQSVPGLTIDTGKTDRFRESFYASQTPISPVRAIYPPDTFIPSIRPSATTPTSPSSQYSQDTPRAGLQSRSFRSPLRKLNMDVIKQSSARDYEMDSASTPLVCQYNVQSEPESTPLSGPSNLPASPSPFSALSQMPSAAKSASSLGQLPLRSARGLATPGATKTTFLDVQGRSIAPRTGVPTPYSAYMPFSPMTPVTPRLIGRKEGRMLRREEARRRGEMVKSGTEIWE